MTPLLEQVLRANVYLQPILFSLAIVTNLINIRVLSSPVLRSSPCTHYLLAFSSYSIIYTCLVCPTQFLRGLGIEWTNTTIGCPLLFYLLFLTPVQAKKMLLLASFDRYCMSSNPQRLHSNATVRRARVSILLASTAVLLYMLPMLAIYQWDSSTGTCQQRLNAVLNGYIFSQMLLFFVFSPLFSITTGLLTIRNIRQQSREANRTTIMQGRRRTEGQLARMLLLQVGVHLILGIPFGATYILNALKPSTRTDDILATRYIALLWQQCDYFISFFLYLLSGSVYREELVRIFTSYRRLNTLSQSGTLQNLNSNPRAISILSGPMVTSSV